MKKRLRISLGLAIMIAGLSLPTVEKFIVDVIEPQPSIREVMEIERPSDELIAQVSPIDDVITDKKDEESFAIFNKEFSDRVGNYETKGQAVLDIYSMAGEAVFGTELQDKYDNDILPLVSDLMKEVMEDYDSQLTDEKREALREKFGAVSWTLGGDNDE